MGMRIILIAFLLQNPANDDFKGFLQTWKQEAANQWEAVSIDDEIDIWFMRKKDLNKQTENTDKKVYVWMKGLHDGNKKAKYLTTRMQLRFDCGEARFALTSKTTYLADGTVYETDSNSYSANPVIPGTIGESWYRRICPDDV